MQKFYDCGIDLGTTNSCIAHPTGDNSCVIIENTQDRMQVTPSSIAIDKRGRMMIGQRARNQENCVTCFKRKMGTEEIISFSGTDKKMTPEELSSEILKSLKRDAESRLSEEMNDVVITVPAAFSSLQNEATKKAAAMAGFRNVILLQEPIAASIAYGAEPDSKEQYWMVFDYGGGTLDVSILSTHDGRLTVINSEGDNYCGGSDIDRLLYENIIKPEMSKQYNINNNPNLDRKIIMTLEGCKIELSSSDTALFEEFESEDNDGTPIEFEYTITRNQLEDLIASTVDRCIEIAKKALDGASKKDGINIEKINKILLVGGSTFIPLVRNKLKEAFDVELDCSLNPMTVVAEGAAIYAATCVAEIEDTNENFESDTPVFRIQYEPITSNDSVNVVGNIENISGLNIDKIKIDSVKSDDASGAIWTSGWVDFLDIESGLFDVDVHITPTGINKFVATICDKTGREIKSENNTFEIRFNDNALKVSAPPATFSVCVLVTDGENNILKPLIDKNTPLPAEGTSVFSTTKELNPAVDSSIDIHIWEGENFRNPDANNWIGCVHIKSSAMDRVLPAGTSIEIKITQDESRTNHITGYIPDADYIIPEETLRDESERVSLMDRIEVIGQKILQLDITVKKLNDNDVDMNGFDKKFYNLQQQYNDILDCIDTDSDKVQLYIKDFYEVHTAILELERAFDKSASADNKASNLDFWKDVMNRYGTPEQKKHFNELSNSYDAADNEANRQYYYDEMDSEIVDVMLDSFEYLGNFYFNNFENDTVQYTDPQKASYWKTQATNAIREKNIGKLRQAIFELLDLRVNSANDSINSVMADLRI